MQKNTPSIFDRIRDLDPVDVVTRLGLEITSRTKTELHIDPPCHESASRASLHLNVGTGQWLCRSCQDVKGNLLQLVEYVLTHEITPAPHRSDSLGVALKWFGDQYGFSVDLRAPHLTAQQAALEAVVTAGEAALAEMPGIQKLILERWGFDMDVCRARRIGFLPVGSAKAVDATLSKLGYAGGLTLAKLAYYAGSPRELVCSFEGRILFPYVENSRPVYLIGRSTEATAKLANGSPPPKYYKLPVDDSDPLGFTNRHLYNHGCMASGASPLIIAEGITDCIALAELGLPVVSPVTVRFREEDKERFVEDLHRHKITSVDVVFDNEASGVGSKGALDTAEFLADNGIRVRVLLLPIEPGKEKADAAEWVQRAGAAALEEFSKLRAAALDLIEHRISVTEIPEDGMRTVDDALELFQPEIDLIGRRKNSAMDSHYARLMKAAVSDHVKLSVSAFTELMNLARRRRRADEKEEDRASEKGAKTVSIEKPAPFSFDPLQGYEPVPKWDGKGIPPPPSEMVEQTSMADHYKEFRRALSWNFEKRKIDAEEYGEHIVNEFTLTLGFLVVEEEASKDLYLIRGKQRVRATKTTQSDFAMLLGFVGGVHSVSGRYAAVYGAVCTQLRKIARRVSRLTFSADVPGGFAVATGQWNGSAAEVTGSGVKVVGFGQTKASIAASRSVEPFKYHSDYDHLAIASELDELMRQVSLGEAERSMLVGWILALPMTNHLHGAPIMRIEGGTGSGKSRTVSMVSTLLAGTPRTARITPAALVALLSTELVTIDDNRETADMNRTVQNAMLQAAHGGSAVKRAGESDTGVVNEQVSGALLTNGIEPIHQGRPEIANRMIVLQCKAEHIRDNGLADDVLYRRAKTFRDHYWSLSLDACSFIVSCRDSGVFAHLEPQVREVMRAGGLQRNTRYATAMYLAWVFWVSRGRDDGMLETVSEDWTAGVRPSIIRARREAARYDAVVTAIWYAMLWLENESTGKVDSSLPHLNYGHDFDRQVLSGVGARKLLGLAKKACREWAGPPDVLGMDRASFISRMNDAIEQGTFEAAGMDVQVQVDRFGQPLRCWDIVCQRSHAMTRPQEPSDGLDF